ncbi:MAG: alpha-amylase [Myxococcota bacterium]
MLRAVVSFTVSVVAAAILMSCGDDDEPGPGSDGAATVTVDVSGSFTAGEALRDANTGASATVSDNGTVSFPAESGDVLLVERVSSTPAPFSWDNATVYFLITDRFQNGDPTNDENFERRPDGELEIGTWHGGDFVGVTQRLDYLEDLGVTAIWISMPVEQMRGWVGGGSEGDFRHYAYAGYWAGDFTQLDPNFGTEDEFRTLIDAAHDRGIRVVLDVVMNHPGYASMADIVDFVPGVLRDGVSWSADWEPGEGETFFSYNDIFINFQSGQWSNWWGPSWIRAGFPSHVAPGSDDLTLSLASLPDFRTNSTAEVDLPVFLTQKAAAGDSNAVAISGASPRDYLIGWLTRYVREFGVDGFRCDTAKHVELDAWQELKDAAITALAEWKSENPDKALDDLPFWMTAEVFPHGVVKDEYYDNGFDSVINFDFQDELTETINDRAGLQDIYQFYADAINVDPEFNVLSYISSHDTRLFTDPDGDGLDALTDTERQKRAGDALLLVPGATQIFYGDETMRSPGPTGSEAQQGTRSDMNFDANPEVLEHWQTIGQFRKNHIAVGAGDHRELAFDGGYAFARSYDDGDVVDDVVVVFVE